MAEIGKHQRGSCTSWRFPVVAFVSLIAAVACITAPGHPYFIARGSEGAPGVRSVMLLPLNVTVALPAELQDPAPRVAKSIEVYLEKSGKTVHAMGLFDARAAWRSAAQKTRSDSEAQQEFGAAARQLALQLGELHPFDALVMPNLVFRQARIYEGSRSAVWDGVKREFQFANESQMHGSIHLMTTVAGTMQGVSLYLLVYNSEGERIFASYGGIDLVHDFDLSSSDQRLFSGMPLKSERLTDASAIREGIRLAFDPYLVQPSEAETEDR